VITSFSGNRDHQGGYSLKKDALSNGLTNHEGMLCGSGSFIDGK
jgi:hypothetical protein